MTNSHPHPYQSKLGIVKVPSDVYKPPEFLRIDGNLQSMKDVIGGGYIEIVRNPHFTLECGCRVVMVVDEEGLLKSSCFPNPRVREFYPRGVISGDVFFIAEGFCLNEDDEEDLDLFSLPDSFITWQGPEYWPWPASRA